MAWIDKIANIVITKKTKTTSQKTFGIPAVLATFAADLPNTAFAAHSRSYGDQDEVDADWLDEMTGAVLNASIYEALSGFFAQDPHPQAVILGRKETALITWAAAINTFEAEDSTWWALTAILDGSTLTDQAIEIEAIATAIEAERKFFMEATTDPNLQVAGTTNIAATLKTLKFKRTATFFHADASENIAMRVLSRVLYYDPGKATWAYKTAVGVTPDVFSLDAKAQAVLDYNSNIYHTVGGVDVTEQGKVASGEYIDIILGIDWLHARLQEAVFGALAEVAKFPFEDAGIVTMVGIVKQVLEKGVDQGILASGSISITYPSYADISVADREDRFLPDIDWSATLVGAIQSAKITGTVSV